MERRAPRPPNIEIRQGNKLPHWTRDGATYSVTFRLADSLPASALAGISKRLAQLDRELASHVAPTNEQLTQIARLKSELIESLLHDAHGACVLRRSECAKIVADALLHFDSQRYRLYAWCVMPNHVHVVVQPLAGYTLSAILHSWKSFTSKAIGKVLGTSGRLWQPESYDHLIRDEADLRRCVQYVLENPVQARLRDWPWVWPVSERLVGQP